MPKLPPSARESNSPSPHRVSQSLLMPREVTLLPHSQPSWPAIPEISLTPCLWLAILSKQALVRHGIPLEDIATRILTYAGLQFPRLAQIEKKRLRLLSGTRLPWAPAFEILPDAVGPPGPAVCMPHISGKDDLLVVDREPESSADRFFAALMPIINSNDDLASQVSQCDRRPCGASSPSDLDAGRGLYHRVAPTLNRKRRARGISHRRDRIRKSLSGGSSAAASRPPKACWAPVDEGDTRRCSVLSALNYVFLWYKSRRAHDPLTKVATMLARLHLRRTAPTNGPDRQGSNSHVAEHLLPARQDWRPGIRRTTRMLRGPPSGRGDKVEPGDWMPHDLSPGSSFG